MDDVTVHRTRVWKATRAVAQGWLEADEETTDSIRERARTLAKNNAEWAAWGFDTVETDAVLSELAAAGIETSQEAFGALAEEGRGPYEIAAHWDGSLKPRGDWDTDLTWLAARALWARWREDDPTPETESDRVEAVIREWRSAKDDTALPNALPAVKRLAEMVDGDVDALDAIDDELPTGLRPWLVSVARAVNDPEHHDDWLAAWDSLQTALLIGAYHEAMRTLMLARHGHTEEATTAAYALESELSSDRSSSAQVAVELATVFEELGEAEHGIDVLEKGLFVTTDEDDQAYVADAMAEHLDKLGRSGELQERLQRVAVARRKARVAERRQKRKTKRSRRK